MPSPPVASSPIMPSRFFALLLALITGVPAFAASTQPTLRVMSYNIHHGEGVDGKVDLERIAKLIVEARADVVALQEVDRGTERTQKRDLPAELAKLTGLIVRFDKNIAHQGGDYGNAVLTKFPLKSAKNTHLKMAGPGEQRGIQQLLLDVRGREVLFLNTHLDHRRDEAERLLSAAQVSEIVAGAGKLPVIFCGDFNATPESQTSARLQEFLTDTWAVVGRGPGFTIPVAKPAKRIDYVWISREFIEPLTMEVLRSNASDHLPVVAELRLK
jgi:endonuclease/exonuclease/phosphatase family metal-dependent hydrolase